MTEADPATVGASSGVAGSLLTLAGLWLKARLMGGNGKDPRTAEAAHEEIDQVKERLTRIEGQLEAVRADNQRNESGISALQAKLDTMHQGAATAQIELATTLGRIEGEMRARRERGTVTP